MIISLDSFSCNISPCCSTQRIATLHSPISHAISLFQHLIISGFNFLKPLGMRSRLLLPCSVPIFHLCVVGMKFDIYCHDHDDIGLLWIGAVLATMCCVCIRLLFTFLLFLCLALFSHSVMFQEVKHFENTVLVHEELVRDCLTVCVLWSVWIQGKCVDFLEVILYVDGIDDIDNVPLFLLFIFYQITIKIIIDCLSCPSIWYLSSLLLASVMRALLRIFVLVSSNPPVSNRLPILSIFPIPVNSLLYLCDQTWECARCPILLTTRLPVVW